VPAAGGEPEPLWPVQEDCGYPQWALGWQSHVPLPGGRVALLHSGRLAVLEPDGAAHDVDVPFDTWLPWLAADGVAPLAVLMVHGGPTAAAVVQYRPEIAYFTSRGFTVVDVDHTGSTGYGRAFRQALRGQWGVVDVEDCEAVARALVAEGTASAVVVRGGSAGGFTVLAALTRGDSPFAAGASYYGVADLLAMRTTTHDFESRYLDGLLGPLPEAEPAWVDRSPVTHADRLDRPVLLLQGLNDPVVPPQQAQRFLDALATRGVAHAYLAFEGEAHGFRRAETVVAALEAELSFYGQVLGFEPPGVPRLELRTG
jgi:dipeptidyl aminopeptidase/acylaminoacyl peptidase